MGRGDLLNRMKAESYPDASPAPFRIPALGRLPLFVPRLNLARRFAVISGAVILLGMYIQGTWVSSKIEEIVKLEAGVAAALYIDGIVSPILRKVAPDRRLTREEIADLDAVLQFAAVRLRVATMKVWSTDGTLLYSSNKQQIGTHYPIAQDLAHAIGGHISVSFEDLGDDENELERAMGVPLVEIYVPIRGSDGMTVAVAEFYERGQELRANLQRSRAQSWIMTGLVSMAMVAALFWMVARANTTIEHQRHALTRRVRQLSELVHQNKDLRSRVQRAAQLTAEENERYLRRLGSDLHDGPAQLISLSLMRLDGIEDALSDPRKGPRAHADLDIVRKALTDTMTDVRQICAGLSMPEIETLPLADALMLFIGDHERRTRTQVDARIDGMPASVPHFVKVCLCRVVQEGLNNAFRHAGGAGQRVSAWVEQETIVLEISDAGPGMSQERKKSGGRFGLKGMSDRLESLGGRLQVKSQPGTGTTLVARLPLMVGGEA